MEPLRSVKSANVHGWSYISSSYGVFHVVIAGHQLRM